MSESCKSATPRSPVPGAAADWDRRWREDREAATWTRFQRIDPAYWNRVWSVPDLHAEANAERYRWVMERLAFKPSDSVLDAGAGSGALSVLLARKVASVTALEPSSTGREQLEQRLAAEGLANVQIRTGRLESMIPGRDLAVHDVALAMFALASMPLVAALLNLEVLARRLVVVVEPAGDRHWQHPELLARLTGEPYRACPDAGYVSAQLVALSIPHRMVTGVYRADYRFATRSEALDWLLRSLGRDDARTRRLAAAYLEERLRPGGPGVVFSASQSLALITWQPGRRDPAR